MNLVGKPLGIKLRGLTRIESLTNSHSVGNHTFENMCICCRKCPLFLNNKGQRKCVRQCAEKLISLDSVHAHVGMKVYQRLSFVCNLCYKVGDFMLNAMYEIFTGIMVERELRLFRLLYVCALLLSVNAHIFSELSRSVGVCVYSSMSLCIFIIINFSQKQWHCWELYSIPRW